MLGIGEISHPVFAATQVMAHPGTSPTVSVPVVHRRLPDADALWAYLAAPAEFFGFGMPAREVLADAIAGFVDAVRGEAGPTIFALHVTIAELEGAAEFVITGSDVQFLRHEAVRIDECDVAFPLTRSTDPQWRRMAARTTSSAEADSLRRWLDDRGHADGVAGGVPFLGALIFEHGADISGIDNDEPISILTQLQECGAIGPVRRTQRHPDAPERVWWISPGYEVHPVAALGARSYIVDGAAPSFARIR
jgi:hypothetical protein